MCGRYKLSSPPDEIARRFGLAETPALGPRYNIAPSQGAPVVRVVTASGSTPIGSRRLELLRWGLVPSWAEDPRVGYRMINARAETAPQKPAFRRAFRSRRCLVVTDGFYEWQPLPSRRKRPFLIRMRDGSPFAFGGLWEVWRSAEGAVLESFAILTTEPNDLLRPIHDRMPLILRPEDHDLWLDPEAQDPARLLPLLRPYPGDEMEAVPVGPHVNNPSFDDPSCAKPLDEEDGST
jgi:putative SOS response-associated peptidase YedK